MMNKELMLIQFSKYLTIGTILVIVSMIIALIGLWIYSEWLIYQQKQSKQLDKVRDKMDGIELKRLLKHQDSINTNTTGNTGSSHVITMECKTSPTNLDQSATTMAAMTSETTTLMVADHH